MKKLYIIALCIFVTGSILAQPTLTYLENAPQIGDVSNIQSVSANGLSHEPVGPDVSWDFSQLNNLTTGQITGIDSSTAPAGNEFPTANIAFNMNDTIFTYCLVNETGLYYLGSQMLSVQNPLYVISEMDKTGVDAFVLFNRLFQPEIDIDLEEHYFPYNLSTQNDNRISLRYAGLLYGETRAAICSNTGIFTGEDVISMILAGANVVQIVSTLYKNGIGQISTILNEVETWMKKKNYKGLDDYRGKLSKKTLNDPFTYKRAQYVDILMKSEEIFKKYPMV